MKYLPLCALLAFCPVSHAVIYFGGDGAGNTTAPADDPGFANVGILNWPSCVYLGSYDTGNWVISAQHVWNEGPSTSVLLNGTSYNIVAGSNVQIAGADLVMFRIDGNPSADPSLRNLGIAVNTPAVDSYVTMIGNGRNRAAGPTYWNVNTATHPYVWTEAPSVSANEMGYGILAGNTMRWGSSIVKGTYNDGATETFYTEFEDVANSAQGAVGDSGGGVFVKNGDQWELAGVMMAISTIEGQPADTVALGNRTFVVDLSSYRDQIMTLIPEADMTMPLASMGVLVAAAGFVVRRRRR